MKYVSIVLRYLGPFSPWGAPLAGSISGLLMGPIILWLIIKAATGEG